MISNLEAKNSEILLIEVSDILKKTIHEIEVLAGNGPDQIEESVHIIRKRLKFLRAFIKLTQFCTDEQNYKPINYILRDSGRMISDCRDAHVRRILLSEFEQNSSVNILTEELNEINNSVIDDIELTILSGISVFDELINKISDERIIEYFRSLEPHSKCLIGGLALGYERSYHAFHSELKSREADLLHEWRKRTKDLQYQQETLLYSIPEQLSPSYEEVVLLCEVLGRINDLFMFLDWLDSSQLSNKSDNQLNDLRNQLNLELKELEEQADNMGHCLFSLSPTEYSEELSKRLEL